MIPYSNKQQARMSMLGVIMALTLLTSLFLGSSRAARAQAAPQLFAETGVADQAADLPAGITRSRIVKVNTDLLRDSFGDALDPSVLQALELNLFDDANYIGVIDAVDDTAGESTSWIGHLDGIPGSYFYLVQAGRGFIAHVGSSDGIYEVSSIGRGLYRVAQLDQSQLVDEPPDAAYSDLGPVLSEADLDARADSEARFDIIVFYTDDARAAEGGTPQMKARIALALTETNQAYANAGITTRMRLVHLEEAPYAETGNIVTDRNRLTAHGDGFLDQVHGRRNEFGADIVALLVEDGGGYCGVAQAIMASADTAFHVTARSCATGYYSFGHETGHLQGMRHDRYVDPETVPFAYGHGYVHRGSTTPERWRTIMAYNDWCSSLGYNCTRLQYFSNHLNTYNGAAMGSFSTARNYRVANNTDLTVANFRNQVIGEDFFSNFNSSMSGWSQVNGSWVLYGSAYLRSTGLANLGASIRHASKYGDLTYTVRMRRHGSCTSCSNRIIIRGNPASLVSTNWWKPSYVFQYTNDGNFSIYYMTSAGTFTTLKPWTASGAIAMNNWNTLKVVAVGRQLKFYINNILVYTAFNSGLRVGSVGFGFYRDAAPGTLYVDYANLSNTPTADINPNADVDQGVELQGGTIDQAP